MTSLSDIIGGLATQLDQLDPKLNVYPRPPGVWEAPAAFVVPPVIDYRQAMRAGVIKFEFDVVFLVAAFDADYQDDLIEYLDWQGPKSLRVRLDANRTLGLTDVDCVAMSARPLGLDEVAGYEGWGGAVQCLAAFTNHEG